MVRVVEAMSENEADCITDIMHAVASYSHDLSAIQIVGCLQYVKSDLMDMAINSEIDNGERLQ